MGEVAVLQGRAGTGAASEQPEPAALAGASLASEADEPPSLDEPAGSGSADLVRAYLRSIGRTPLLGAAEEVELATAVEAAVFAAERADALEAAGRLGPALRTELVAVVAAGQRAKTRLVEANLRLVVSIAKRYAGRGVPLLDLVQEGNLGLIRAVEKFDYTRGFKFSTYASWWIRQAVSRAVADQARTIRIPVHLLATVNRVGRTQRLLVQRLGRDPSDAEVAAQLDLTTERVAELRRLAAEPVSLHLPVGEDGGAELGELVEDCEALSPVEQVAARLLAGHLDAVLGHLGERERALVRLRYGLTDGQPRTLEEVGRAFGVTRERARQIEAKSLAKLRQPQLASQLRDYLGGS